MNRQPLVVCLCVVILVAAIGGTCAAKDSTVAFIVHNSKDNSLLESWSRVFSGPDDLTIKGVKVSRKTDGDYVAETGRWDCTQQALANHDLRLTVSRGDADNVPYCTKLKIDVTFNTTDVSWTGGSQREYATLDGDEDCVLARLTGGQTDCFESYLDLIVACGGPAGRNVRLGSSGQTQWVPANQYLYAYQINHTGGDNGITKFRISNVPSFSGFSVYGEAARFDDWAMFDNITLYAPPDNDVGLGMDDIGVPLFSGSGSTLYGVAPSWWGLQDNDAVAMFSGNGLTDGDSSRILLAFSPNPPVMPHQPNALVGFGPWDGDDLTQVRLLVPAPEPGAILLWGSGLTALAWFRRRRHPRGG